MKNKAGFVDPSLIYFTMAQENLTEEMSWSTESSKNIQQNQGLRVFNLRLTKVGASDQVHEKDVGKHILGPIFPW